MISFIKRIIHRDDNLWERDQQFIDELRHTPQVKRRRNRR